MEKKSYIGRVKNSGSQSVKAPIATPKRAKSVKKTGTDLRQK